MIILINPNSTVSMTDAMLRTMRETVPSGDFEGWTSHDGPQSIQGEADGLAATQPLLDVVQAASTKKPRAIIIGCFDDTALDAARKLAECPVIGIGQAAYHAAAVAGGRFSVVTTLAVSVPIIEANIRAYGLSDHLSKVRASDVPVLDLETDPEAATRKVIEEINTAWREDDIHTAVLGCGGMVDIAEQLDDVPNLRVIDGVRAAASIAHIL